MGARGVMSLKRKGGRHLVIKHLSGRASMPLTSGQNKEVQSLTLRPVALPQNR